MQYATIFGRPARLAVLSAALLVAPLTGVGMGQTGNDTTSTVTRTNDARDDGFDWGWLGLLGLAGLLGMRRNDRDHGTVRHTT